MKAKVEPGWLRFREAMDYSRISRERLIAWWRAGKLEVLELGPHTRLINKADLELLMRSEASASFFSGPARALPDPAILALVRRFVQEACITTSLAKSSSKDLYACFKATIALDVRVSKQTFGRCLSHLHFIRDRGAAGRRLWLGLMPLAPPPTAMAGDQVQLSG
jgi:hypothetical protein